MSKENLIQYNGQTPEIARENGRKGGIASGKAKQRKKLMREVLNELLPMEVSEPELRVALESVGLEPTHEVAVAFAAIQRAERGDIEAARFIRDAKGEKPTDNKNLSVASFMDTPVQALDLRSMTDEQLYMLIGKYENMARLTE